MNGPRKPRRKPLPLDEGRLVELALAYVGRFATTRGKLRGYLNRKLRERGWDGAADPNPDAIAERLSSQGYIDDAGYALSKARALSARGYGRRRVAESLRGAGVAAEDGSEALELAQAEALQSAVRFAQRRRIGPFALTDPADPRTREKWIAAMIRAGHGFEMSKAIGRLPSGKPVDLEDLARRLRLDAA